MKLQRLLIFAALLATSCTEVALGPAQISVGILSSGGAAAPSSPTIPNPACFTVGSSTNYTTSAVNTTGAKVVVVILSGTWAFTATVTDILTGATLAELPNASAFPGVAIFHELLPSTTGTGATFNIATSATPTAVACVLPIVGLTNGAYDSNVQGASNSSTTCQTAAITPGSGSHMVIAGYAGSSTSPVTIDSAYTIAGQIPVSGGTNYQGAAAYLAQTAGATTQPTWGNASFGGCTLASYN